ncbi:ras-related protein rab-8a [Plakobranchus ocellatus]|uniref:Ras-related protein rab-8a n=1 Tax=Plakobranchus ocellatus TaxID=259542 RepID=A0AAV4CPX2_9GAST|nr:ras-related protein rab-8a [Plakobranchus ocellatus]
MAASYDYLFKIILIGDSASKLMCAYVGDQVEFQMRAVGVDFLFRLIELDGKKIKLQLWDGSTFIRSKNLAVPASCYRASKGIMLIYDVTEQESFDKIKSIKQDVDDKKDKDAVIMIIGNNCHLTAQRQVSTDAGHQLASEYGALFIEISIQEGINIEQGFLTLASKLKETKEKCAIAEPPESDAEVKEKGSCQLM